MRAVDQQPSALRDLVSSPRERTDHVIESEIASTQDDPDLTLDPPLSREPVHELDKVGMGVAAVSREDILAKAAFSSSSSISTAASSRSPRAVSAALAVLMVLVRSASMYFLAMQ